MMRVAYFDLDKTILNKDSIFPFMMFYLKKNPSSIMHYIALIPYFLLFCLKIIDNQSIKYQIAHIFKNIDIEFGDEIGKEFADEIVPKLYYKDALDEIKKLKNQGYTLILVTASFEIYAKYIAENLGFDRCMGTELWTFRGKYTGYMYGKNCYGKAKRYRLFTEHFFPHHSDKNIAYSDSISDLPLFDFADTKVCVNPDNRLKEHALKNKDKGFTIVNWR
ncbi:HAD family hydrolase [Brachyspira hyodysenteriae]|uniref:HAD family hydrolase n=1 Tax=Brachyspira hyodysenteriae TaxID=159 RepID=UPI00063D9FAC|nr:HAD-IB family hydrolase [Brachyspira hyodysenteriae]KLI50613.1 phosphoserine phosphatase [Brachyspira hyodysenteriae]MCZ9938300.1 HAD-IB family hydrolase [Brachyspira hyodysenteriae]MDA0053916.1 HAD-IB family hydrolase [Brachyspira hyodysenteriae]TVL57465.1 phosphoserine phosphatase [Brachyspira hyodysenteriae]TVL79466.1 phosphoserine phosphatase [Brachyspira hyodysenteriae]